MTNFLRRFVVHALWISCEILDRLPGGPGCRLGLAQRSAELDEQWNIGVWG